MGKAIQPYTFIHLSTSNPYRFLSLKIRPGNIAVTMSELEHKWAALVPGAAFEYQFMDESLQHIYVNELQLKKAANAATLMAGVIALLGVLGLLSFSVQKRKKEIAIRKVIGASVVDIIRIFIREYLPLLVTAGLIASPLAYLVMHRWLNDYATRIGISAWPFAGAIGCLALIMVVLIVLQILKAALSNPVKNLKVE
jgi:putative ABC transport system permease protein